MNIDSFLAAHWLDILTTLLGLIYIWLEYRASIALWLVGIVMPALDIYLYWSHGLYGDAGMAAYYTVAALYGYAMWKWGAAASSKKQGGTSRNISHMPAGRYLPATLFFAASWWITYYVLTTWTNSTVPLLDAFTNALSIVALWALSRKYIEQWFFWIAVDMVCTMLYIQKGIPFKAGLYGLYVAIAIMGYFKWRKMMIEDNKLLN